MLLSFSMAMLVLLLIARYRSPRNGIIRIIWFFLSLLPSELPWAAALLQLSLTFLLLFFVEPLAVKNGIALMLSALTILSKSSKNMSIASNGFRNQIWVRRTPLIKVSATRKGKLLPGSIQMILISKVPYKQQRITLKNIQMWI